MYEYMHIFIYTHTYIHTYTNLYVEPFLCMLNHSYTWINHLLYVGRYIYTHTHTYIYIFIYLHAHTCIFSFISAHMLDGYRKVDRQIREWKLDKDRGIDGHMDGYS